MPQKKNIHSLFFFFFVNEGCHPLPPITFEGHPEPFDDGEDRVVQVTVSSGSPGETSLKFCSEFFFCFCFSAKKLQF